MSPSLHDLGIDILPPDDRLRLIGEIWDSLSHGQPNEIPEEHREELDRRLAEADADPHGRTPWKEVFERLRKNQ